MGIMRGLPIISLVLTIAVGLQKFVAGYSTSAPFQLSTVQDIGRNYSHTEEGPYHNVTKIWSPENTHHSESYTTWRPVTVSNALQAARSKAKVGRKRVGPTPLSNSSAPRNGGRPLGRPRAFGQAGLQKPKWRSGKSRRVNWIGGGQSTGPPLPNMGLRSIGLNVRVPRRGQARPGQRQVRRVNMTGPQIVRNAFIRFRNFVMNAISNITEALGLGRLRLGVRNRLRRPSRRRGTASTTAQPAQRRTRNNTTKKMATVRRTRGTTTKTTTTTDAPEEPDEATDEPDEATDEPAEPTDEPAETTESVDVEVEVEVDVEAP